MLTNSLTALAASFVVLIQMPSMSAFFILTGAVVMAGGLITECVALVAMERYGLAKNAKWKVVGFVLFYVGAAIFVTAQLLK